MDVYSLIEIRPSERPDPPLEEGGSADLGLLKVGVRDPKGGVFDVEYRTTQPVGLQRGDFMAIIAGISSVDSNVNVTLDVCSTIAYLRLSAKEGVLPERSDVLAFVIAQGINERAGLHGLQEPVKLVRTPLELLD